MGWIVTSINPDALEVLVREEAREAARAIVREAERAARAMTRGAQREAADVSAYLDELERFGVQTRGLVREQRRTLRPERPERPQRGRGARRARPAAPPEPDGPIRVRPGRASLHDSPLRELFRATTAG